jgi:uncharacterized membrane protein
MTPPRGPALWRVMALLASLIALYALALLAVPAVRPPFLRDRFLSHPWIAAGHLAGGAAALLIGALQLNAGLRARAPGVHRWLGRVYVAAVLLAGVGGLRLARISQGGPVAHLGFAVLAMLWLGTTAQAYRRVRVRDLDAHRRWMIRSYSLTLAAVSLRIYLPLSLLAGAAFDPAYQAIAWLCWIPNLLAAEWWLRRPAASGGSPAVAV